MTDTVKRARCILCGGEHDTTNWLCPPCGALFRDSLESQRYEQHATAGRHNAADVAMQDFVSRTRAERLAERRSTDAAAATATPVKGASHAA